MPPANDAFANREVISGASGSVSGTLVDATSDGASYDGSRPSVWYEFTPPTDGTYKITFTQTTPGSSGVLGSVAVKYVATPTGVYYVSGIGVDAVDTPHFSHVPLVAGTVYALVVTCFSSIYEGDFTIDWELDAQPANDDFANATDLGSLSGTLVDETNIGATEEVNDRYYPDSRGFVWYKVDLPAGTYTKRRFKIRLDPPTTPTGDIRGEYGTSFGETASSLVIERAQTGGSEFSDYFRSVAILPNAIDRWITVTPGETWYIGVGNFNDTPTDFAVVPGNFNLVWDLSCDNGVVGGSPPPYDDIANARNIALAGETFSISTFGATNETNEATYNEGSPVGSVWLKLDLTGETLGDEITFAVTAQGDGCAVAYFDCWYDADGDFVPASPDFSKLEYPSTLPDGEVFYDGDNEGVAQTIALAGGYVYYITVIDWNFATQGDFNFTWGALGSVACPNGPPIIINVAVTRLGSNTALVEADICPAGGITTVHVDFGTTAGYGQVTPDFTLPTDNTFHHVHALIDVSGGCGGLAASTLYHYRFSAHNPFPPGGTTVSSDHTLTTDASSAPANNNIGSAEAISGASGSVIGDNAGATEETGEHTCLFGTDHTLYDEAPNGTQSVWYDWTCPATGDYAFWTTTPDNTLSGHVGLRFSILTVIDGTTFATANVVAQNESAQGQPPPFTGSQYPFSLAQFHAISGTHYWIAVDGDGCDGMFQLNWGAPVDAFPAVRACSLLSRDDTTATFQFDVNPQSATGHYWANAHCGSLLLDFSAPHTPISGFEWQTVTSTVTGLQPNSPYGGGAPCGNNLAWADNPAYPGTDFGASAVCDGFYTLMPDQFPACASDASSDFAGDDCTSPTGWVAVTDGYRIHDNAMGAYEWQEANQANFSNADPQTIISRPASNILALDLAARLVQVGGKQDLGFTYGSTSGTHSGSKYFIRSDADAGEIQLVFYDNIGDTETVLDSVATLLSDGDSIGIRYSAITDDIDGYKKVGGIWTHILNANDTSVTIDTDAGGAFGEFIAQSAPTGPPTINTSQMFDVGTAYGQVTIDIFPPFSCPVGHDKYEMRGNWAGPYFGGSGDNDYPNPAVDCPNWWAQLVCHAFGRVDCSLESNTNVGSDGEFETYMHDTEGITAALSPFYMTTSEYNTEISNFESTAGAGLYTWDTDMGHKGIDAIQASLDDLVTAFGAQGAFKQANVGDSGRTSYGVFMPVAVAPGRIDDFALYKERCPINVFNLVSFAGIRFGPKAVNRIHVGG